MAYGQKVFLFGRLRGSGETIWETKANFGVVSNEIHYRYLQTRSVIEVVVSGFFDSLGLFSEPSSKQIETSKLWFEVDCAERMFCRVVCGTVIWAATTRFTSKSDG